MTVDAPERDPAVVRDRLLDDAAVPGLDLDAARARVQSLVGGRRRLGRGVLGAAAAVVLALGVGWVALGDDDPDQVLADRTDPAETTTTAPSSTTTSASTTVAPAPAPLPAPLPTMPAAPSTIPTTSVVTTTTVPPNQRMVVEVRATESSVQAGGVATLDLAWVDPDHAGGEPAVAIDWGDPAVKALDLPPATSRCDSPGTSGAGRLQPQFRYATPGPKVVRVTVTTCGGDGAYSESVSTTTSITVGDATMQDGSAGRAVVAVAPRTANGLPVLPALDAASALLVPADPLDPEQTLDPRDPALAQFTSSGPATVLVVPATFDGTLRLTWEGSTCVSTTTVGPSGASSTPVLTAPLESSC